MHCSRNLDLILVPNPLPGFGEDGILAALKPRRILVERAGQSGRMLDARIDKQFGHGPILASEQRVPFSQAKDLRLHKQTVAAGL
jgi:hypothetical protein